MNQEENERKQNHGLKSFNKIKKISLSFETLDQSRLDQFEKHFPTIMKITCLHNPLYTNTLYVKCQTYIMKYLHKTPITFLT